MFVCPSDSCSESCRPISQEIAVKGSEEGSARSVFPPARSMARQRSASAVQQRRLYRHVLAQRCQVNHDIQLKKQRASHPLPLVSSLRAHLAGTCASFLVSRTEVCRDVRRTRGGEVDRQEHQLRHLGNGVRSQVCGGACVLQSYMTAAWAATTSSPF